MINGLLGRINESFHISKHFVLNVQQHTSERQAVAAHTNAFFYFDTLLWLLFTRLMRLDDLWFLFGLNYVSVSGCEHRRKISLIITFYVKCQNKN